MSLKSEEIGRLKWGSIIEEIKMAKSPGGTDRLHYKLISGTGPATGWVNIDRLEQIPSGSGCSTNVEFAKMYGAELYHQTDTDVAGIILSTQEMKPGSKGLAGGGIYFATTPELTGHKAEGVLGRARRGGEGVEGVVLKAYVRLGRILTLEGKGDTKMTPEKLKAEGYDSVCIARKVSSGQEYVVYDPAQVLHIERA